MPAGYDAGLVRMIGWQSACSFYELVAQILHLAVTEAIEDTRAIVWGDVFFTLVEGMRPEWTLDDPRAFLYRESADEAE